MDQSVIAVPKTPRRKLPTKGIKGIYGLELYHNKSETHMGHDCMQSEKRLATEDLKMTH